MILKQWRFSRRYTPCGMVVLCRFNPTRRDLHLVCRRVMPFVGIFFLLSSFLIVTASVAASQESFSQVENLDLISRQTSDSLHRILTRAYICYLGLDQSHQYSEMPTFSAESMFDDLKCLLSRTITNECFRTH